jgi:hypothetical protein
MGLLDGGGLKGASGSSRELANLMKAVRSPSLVPAGDKVGYTTIIRYGLPPLINNASCSANSQ